ncbi:hypothetical protein Salat_0903400 [Sesamum alatum]|uniref:Uncharacterized protein n=1 Tax=Sesamum alatum TaxID=300844 RepID=A0AAE1YKW6_9LAMI|nr:hypothetical protein Salat_0903400 [Sesamum alatum]
MARGSSSCQYQKNQAALLSKTNSTTLLKQDGKQRNSFSILADLDNTEEMITKFTGDKEMTQALKDSTTTTSMDEGPMTDNPVPSVDNRTTKPDSKSAAPSKSAELDKTQVEAQETQVNLTKEQPGFILNVKPNSDQSLMTKKHIREHVADEIWVTTQDQTLVQQPEVNSLIKIPVMEDTACTLPVQSKQRKLSESENGPNTTAIGNFSESGLFKPSSLPKHSCSDPGYGNPSHQCYAQQRLVPPTPNCLLPSPEP